MKDSPETTSPEAYILDARLKGPKESILSLAVSPNGRLLASGGKPIPQLFAIALLIACQGEDGVFIWDLQTKKLTGTLRYNRNVRGATSCVAWLKGGESQDILCQGTVFGFISVWRRSLGEVS
jgi:WD40 repeat protein